MADGDGVMLQALFNTAEEHSGQEITVTFDDGRISWEVEAVNDTSAKGEKHGQGLRSGSVAIDDVILAELTESSTDDGKGDVTVPFTIHYVIHIVANKEQRLVASSVNFFGTVENCIEWVSTIHRSLEAKFPKRPKHLLAFINPISGKKNGRRVFEQNVQPLLNKFVREVEVIVTEKPRHIEEVLLSKDLEGVDGIVTVGGDGTLAEAVNGLISRSVLDQGVDENNPDVNISPISIPIGIIPTGSGNIIILSTIDTKDVVTATLCIILGKTLGKDIGSVHSGGKLVRYTNLCTFMGLFADWLRKADKSRWMGMGRLLWGGIYSFAKHSSVEVEIDYLSPGEKEGSETLSEGVSRDTEQVHTDWRRLTGQFVQCDGYMFEPTSQGAEVRRTFEDGQMSLLLVKPCSRIAHMKFLSKFLKPDSEMYNVNYVEHLKTTSFKIRPTGEWKTNENSHYVYVDGDMIGLPEPEFSVRLHKGLIQLFTRKPDCEQGVEHSGGTSDPVIHQKT